MMRRMIRFAPVFLVGAAVFVALGGWFVQLLWNALLPPLFGWHTVTFWQALGLLALCRILFAGFGMHGGPRPHTRRHFAERWERMTPEERERFREGLRRGWGPFGRAEAQPPTETT